VKAARDLRTPFFIVAVMFVAAAFLLEIGSSWALSPAAQSTSSQLGIPSLWLLDISLLWALGLSLLSLIVDKNLVARTQGIATLILSIIIVILGFKLFLTALIELLIMIALLSSFFGWLVYFALFAFFNTGAAATVLSLLTLFKLVAVVLLVLAQQSFLANKGLVLLFVLSLVCDLVLSFLHGFPPGVLVSVTDAIGAIVICIVAIVYAIFQAIWAIVAIVRAAV
jgi:hypothetical protein